MPKRPADRPSIPPSRHRPSPAAPIPSRNRAPELSPPPGPPPAETFRDAVAAIKAIADAQAWRTAALRRQPLWREFAVHWLSIAPSMLDAVGDGPLETRGLPLDERVAVCWAATGALTDAEKERVMLDLRPESRARASPWAC